MGEAAAHLVLARDEGAGRQLRQEGEPLAVLGAEAFGAAGPVAAAAADGMAALAAEPAVLGHLRVGHQRGDGVDARHGGHVDQARAEPAAGRAGWRSCGRSHGRTGRCPRLPACRVPSAQRAAWPTGRARRARGGRRPRGGGARSGRDAEVGGPAAAVPRPRRRSGGGRPAGCGAARRGRPRRGGGCPVPEPRAVGGPPAAAADPDRRRSRARGGGTTAGRSRTRARDPTGGARRRVAALVAVAVVDDPAAAGAGARRVGAHDRHPPSRTSRW